MDLVQKVTKALTEGFHPEHIHVEYEDGIYGHIVTNRFRRMSGLDRQNLIDQVLNNSSVKFTKAELRKVYFIMTYTPAEFKELVLNGTETPAARKTKQRDG
jgi:acid stress-induced BolA-like protein IbaG/YrbA